MADVTKDIDLFSKVELLHFPRLSRNGLRRMLPSVSYLVDESCISFHEVQSDLSYSASSFLITSSLCMCA